MNSDLAPGENTAVPKAKLEMVISAGHDIETSVFCLRQDGKTHHDSDFVFYGNLTNTDRTIHMTAEGSRGTFSLDLARIDADVERIAVTINTPNGDDITHLKTVGIKVLKEGFNLLSSEINTSKRKEASLILGEFYRRNNMWKFRLVSQGFYGGLKPLAEHYGVDILEEDTSHPASASQTPTRNPPASAECNEASAASNPPPVTLEQDTHAENARIPPSNSGSPPKRNWMAAGISTGILVAIAALVLMYLGFCFVYGLAWTTEFSSTYGLLIIRLAFAAILAIISIVAMPFSDDTSAFYTFLSWSIYVAPCSFCVGFALGLIPSDESTQ